MKKVFVGMSGGVDSSVAAALLKEQGYEVTGVTMLLGQAADGEDGCGAGAAEDAKRVAERLGIDHCVLDFRQDFQSCVIDYFVEEYLAGRTPNPCIACNRRMKWGALLNRALEAGADYVATGHYAGVERLPNGRYALRKSASAARDQTYALYALTQEQLARTLFPLGGLSKEAVREKARALDLPVADKPDSQEICFVPDGDYAAFIDREAGERVPAPGNFVTKEGRILGRHKGIIHYTLGQRRGLGLPMGERVFVTGIRPETNEVIVGADEENYSRRAVCGNVNYMSVDGLESPVRVLAKIRYNHRGEYCVIGRGPDGRVTAEFERPVRAVTPGQAIVFYDGEYVLGGGIIVREDGRQ